MFQLIRSNRGQASVMIGMMMLTFLLFFTFVVNTGMLVQAKINLQNAADLAAYAGAATQARQLNDISYLNYEMRRQYKKFLFRYYVMGNVAQKGFPSAPGGPTAHVWSPDNGVTLYNVPAVCLIFNANDNYCQLGKLPPIVGTPNNGVDLINSTLNEQLAALEGIRELNCGRIAQSNLDVLLLWLYNTDPTLATIQSQLSDPNAKGIINVTTAISQGLGLVPREIILNQRIKTLEGYVNAIPQTAVTVTTAQGLKTAPDPNANERTIQAFYSAFYTLGPNVFDDQFVEMDELMPTSGSQANLLALKPVQGNFDAYAVGYEQLPTPGTTGNTCSATMVPVTVKTVPLGVEKDPTVLTYYAVRLKAQAQILFSPFGPMNIKAYAAARPFGSRIGPEIAGDNAATALGYSAQANVSGVFASQTMAGYVPNLPVDTGDSAAQGKGWDTQLVLGTLYQAMFGSSPAAGASQTIGQNNAASGYQAAMVPNPYEGGFYNIMNDQVNDPFVVNFDTNHQIKFWAPIFPPGQQGTLQQDVKTALQDIFTTPNTAGVKNTFAPTAAASDAQLQTSLINTMLTYLNSLSQPGGGENGEGMNIVVLQDPFTGSNGQPLALSPNFMATDPNQYRTSWVTTNNSAYTATGRVGYSVKFVSFDSLLNPKSSTDGSTMFTNSLPIDNEAETDGIKSIQH
jgi:hypothetical protein